MWSKAYLFLHGQPKTGPQGLNDAPASAYVSLSPISAGDLTQAQPDAVFLGDRLKPVQDAITIARRARPDEREPLVRPLYNAVAVPIAIAGLVTPPDRRARHVGLLNLDDAQRFARKRPPMNVLVCLVPMALGLGLAGLFVFLWALRSGQYGDVDGTALRVLSDDDIELENR